MNRRLLTALCSVSLTALTMPAVAVDREDVIEAARQHAPADAKIALKSDRARAEQAEQRNEAEPAAARARCRTLDGAARKACVKDAELKYDD